MGAVLSSRHASKHELETIYGVEDLYLFAEMIQVDAHNRHLAATHKKRSD